MRLFSVLFLVGVMWGCGVRYPPGTEYVRKAEESARKGDYHSAIAAYRRHISARLSEKERADWENPWFYLLLIGDLELRMNDPQKGLATYLEARSRGIHESLVSDRVRMIAAWHEKRKEYSEAMRVLTTHRELDPLLFDATLDRIAKLLSRVEDEPISKDVQ